MSNLVRIHVHGHGFYELSRMLMRRNVNNDVSKDSSARPWTHDPYFKFSVKFEFRARLFNFHSFQVAANLVFLHELL